MSFSDGTKMINELIAGFVFGVIGLWLVKEGRRRANTHSMAYGLGLMIFPYFCHGVILTWGVGFLLCFLAYHFWN